MEFYLITVALTIFTFFAATAHYRRGKEIDRYEKRRLNSIMEQRRKEGAHLRALTNNLPEIIERAKVR